MDTRIEPAFPLEEFEARLARTRRAMDERGIDLLIVSDPSNMNWLTGYDGWSFYVHQAVLLPLDDDPIWFGREQDVSGARRTTYLDESRLCIYPDEFVQSVCRHPIQVLARIIRERGLESRRIGVEMDNYYFSAAAFTTLREALPDAVLVDTTGLVNWQRAVKSARELDYMEKAARIVEVMHARIGEVIEPGMRKCDLVAEIYDAGLRGTDGHGGDYPAIVPLLPSGADAAAPHLTWDDKPLQRDAGTFFEIAGCYRRYHCPLSRTIYLGQPPAHIGEAEKAVLEGLDAGIEAARPGQRTEDIARAFFAVLRRYGIEKNSRAGYPIGLSYPPDWGERTSSIRIGDKTVLEPGMTFHFMTGLWMSGRPEGDWGLEITESIVITDKGARCLASVPRELLIKP